MSAEPQESFPDRVERIRKDHNVTLMEARRVAAAEIRLEQKRRDKRLADLAESMRTAQPQNEQDPSRGNQ